MIEGHSKGARRVSRRRITLLADQHLLLCRYSRSYRNWLLSAGYNFRQPTNQKRQCAESWGRPVPSTPDITTQQQEKVPPMFKKTLISLAVASSLGLTGCFSGSNSGGNDNPKPQYSADSLGKTYPIFNPAKGQLPLPNDLIFDSTQKDGTFGVDDSPDNSGWTIISDDNGGSSNYVEIDQSPQTFQLI